MDEIQIDFLTRKLIEDDLCCGDKSNDDCMHHIHKDSVYGDKNVSIRESEAILVIKRLQEQVCVSFSFLLPPYVPFLFDYFFLNCLSHRLRCWKWRDLLASKIWIVLLKWQRSRTYVPGISLKR